MKTIDVAINTIKNKKAVLLQGTTV